MLLDLSVDDNQSVFNGNSRVAINPCNGDTGISSILQMEIYFYSRNVIIKLFSMETIVWQSTNIMVIPVSHLYCK